MKPLFLELQAFGPYIEKQTVDFEKLTEKGIFLIKGATGSGKTTIFDAMTFALYGGSSGEDEKSRSGRNDLEEWRCNQAGKEDETYVAFTFSENGHKYCFRRGVVQKRKNLSSNLSAGEFDENGVLIPFFENPKKEYLNNKAVELIGLTREQFRQVVLLPQGQFEKFLIADTADKRKILQSIFGSEQWQVCANNFYTAASEKKKNLGDEKEKIISSLQEDALTGLDELAALILSLKAQLEEVQNRHELFKPEEKREALADDIALFERFKPLHTLEDKLSRCESHAGEYHAKEAQYHLAEKAESVRELISAYEKASGNLQERTAKLNRLKTVLSSAKEEACRATAAKQEHDENSPLDSLQERKVICESKRELYSGIDAIRKELSAAERALAQADQAAADAKEKYTAAVRQAAKARSEKNASEMLASEYWARYYRGINGEIASLLVNGSPCPVCGSTVHPNPAPKSSDSISKAEVDAKEKELSTKNKLWEAAEKKREEAETAERNSASELGTAKTLYAKAKEKFDNAQHSLIPGIPDAAALEKAIAAIQSRVNEYQQKSSQLQQEVDAAAKALAAAETDLKTAEEEVLSAKTAADKQRSSLLDEVKAKGFDTADQVKGALLDLPARTQLHDQVVKYNSELSNLKNDLNSLKSSLQGFREPDSSKFSERNTELTAELSDYQKNVTALSARIDRLEEKQKRLSKLEDHYRRNITEAERDLAFAKKLRGDAGIGIETYVLAIMFGQVIEEANRMLRNVHGGRYRLYRTDDKVSGNKRGLELKVYDSHSPEADGRGVKMLSGGEKFLVSLALSIGMSTVAQKSGVKIEALFIDEGFGTLDDSSIADALNVLESVRRTSGQIGIISHVPLLEDAIPTHLEVLKSENGSHIRVN